MSKINQTGHDGGGVRKFEKSRMGLMDVPYVMLTKENYLKPLQLYNQIVEILYNNMDLYKHDNHQPPN